MQRTLARAAALAALAGVALAGGDEPQQGPFRRIATFPVFLNTDIDTESVAEIVTASEDGNTLVYTDSENESLGFVDLTNPLAPAPAGNLPLPGEPTSVAVVGGFALASVNTSVDFVDTSGSLEVVDIQTQTIVRSLPLGGQPDAIAVSPDGRFAAVAIENERDEDLGDGAPPQLPAGFLVVVDLVGDDPADWGTRAVDLTGVADLFPEDPEPEFVDINRFNIAAVTLQENNHVVLVSLELGVVLASFSAGTVDLEQVDVNENDLVEQTASLTAVPREPDAVTWIGDFALGTADEGDLDGGSRGFTTWTVFGQTLYEPGNELEHAVARIGHYPEDRSENKGNEPEGIEYARFPGGDRYLFVGSERSSVVFVYEVERGFLGISEPRFVQVLPTGVGPEGLVAIPERDLFVVASEVDDRGDKIRSSIMVYARTAVGGNYPSIESVDRADGTPIPWAALSGLAVDRHDDELLYTVHDSFYGRSRVYEIDASSRPAVITAELPIVDSFGRLADGLRRIADVIPGAPDFDPDAIVHADGTVNLDLEGVATSATDGVLWVCSEGAGNLTAGVSDADDRPFTSPNLILRLVRNASGDALEIVGVVAVPIPLTLDQFRFGLEGVAEGADGSLYVAFQRAWQVTGDPADRARIGRFDLTNRAWTFAYYPLDAPESANGGWVGLGDLAPLADGRLAVLERDNQGGPDAAVKRVYTIDPLEVVFTTAEAGMSPTLTKTLASDLLEDGAFDPFRGFVFEKVEGLAVRPRGGGFLVNDNDGVDDNSGETRLVRIPGLIR